MNSVIPIDSVGLGDGICVADDAIVALVEDSSAPATGAGSSVTNRSGA
ncbi:hypothetical protein K6U06_14200 [Acidiferrimicrobium sp. IK]|nr:hypothetical protein [Acidiferrimicrobium sp. IK]MCU4185521.1 hypothetical protein [Acidiferrimicrobium sp. IK]